MSKVRINLISQPQAIYADDTIESILSNLDNDSKYLTVISDAGTFHINKQNIAYIFDPILKSMI